MMPAATPSTVSSTGLAAFCTACRSRQKASIPSRMSTTPKMSFMAVTSTLASSVTPSTSPASTISRGGRASFQSMARRWAIASVRLVGTHSSSSTGVSSAFVRENAITPVTTSVLPKPATPLTKYPTSTASIHKIICIYLSRS